MIKTCMFCQGEHGLKECPHFADTKTYLKTFSPRADAPPPEARPRASLASNLFEELFGKGAELVLQDVPDHPEVFTADEVNLAWQILGGHKKIKTLPPEEKDMLNSIALRLAQGHYPTKMAPPVLSPQKQYAERHWEDDEGPPYDGEDQEITTRTSPDPYDG